ncbi:N-acetyltransferase [Leifsonia sp. LS1]|uniref:GNAT family N-acetyltransferase n=1 Tax=Leifsonia sp. LS1 TaxID=2828483 RepID=UPI001CFF2CA6|nr:GNAT family protein [Leifsonia sp. LS1]GIT81706.1 N-acetyltransferase [Leifsonia sp. LS1]
MLTLRTPRLVLDAPRESDIPAVLAACQDEDTSRWVPLPQPYTRASAEFFVRSYCPHGLASGQYTVWAIRPGETAPLLGVVEVRRDEKAGSASLGCWLEPGSRGRGVMREALTAVCAYALATDGLGFERLRWECLVGNEVSRRLASSVGFRFDEGAVHRVRFHDEDRDALVGELLRGDGSADR